MEPQDTLALPDRQAPQARMENKEIRARRRTLEPAGLLGPLVPQGSNRRSQDLQVLQVPLGSNRLSQDLQVLQVPLGATRLSLGQLERQAGLVQILR